MRDSAERKGCTESHFSQICFTSASTGTLTSEAQTVVISSPSRALWLPAPSKQRNHSGPGRDADRQPGRHSTFRTSPPAICSERTSARGTCTLLKHNPKLGATHLVVPRVSRQNDWQAIIKKKMLLPCTITHTRSSGKRLNTYSSAIY